MMMEKVFNSIEEILNFAVQEEESAGEFYKEQFKKTTNVELRSLWQQLSNDEVRHKAILLNVLDKLEQGIVIEKYSVSKIPDYKPVELPDKKWTEIESAIITAIQNENEAYFMYSNLAEKMLIAEHKTLLLTLASDEYKHREALLKEL